MSTDNLRKVLPTLLFTSIILSGCTNVKAATSNCDISEPHVHTYTKVMDNGHMVKTDMASEALVKNGYNWTENCYAVSPEEAAIYQFMALNKVFLGRENWDYLFAQMAHSHDYMEYYYEYYTPDTIEKEGYMGEKYIAHINRKHCGWTKNSHSDFLTGRTRIYHHQFYGYKIVKENGRFYLEKSPLVDDIREILDAYPFYSEYCVETVYAEIDLSKSEMARLTPNDFTIFDHPNLTQRSKILK